ncbi:leucine-rich repeat-containing protein 8D [Perkinsela sp. CCAP 1560/4]|nr:leucine-rich repeat-containing protein 8D [Perkinsela sp. CCAP 1560/4]|eukprot:KNH04223.1 leucine-rich repeat-containing protein 8D [Perkinsela sp. CCAP 1560/4]
MTMHHKADRSKGSFDSKFGNKGFFTRISNENKLLKEELTELRQSIEKMGKMFSSTNTKESFTVLDSEALEKTGKRETMEEQVANDKEAVGKTDFAHDADKVSAEQSQKSESNEQPREIPKDDTKSQTILFDGNFHCFNEDFHIGSYSDYVTLFDYFDFVCNIPPLEESVQKSIIGTRRKHSFGRSTEAQAGPAVPNRRKPPHTDAGTQHNPGRKTKDSAPSRTSNLSSKGWKK